MSSIEEQRGPKKILVNLEKNNQYNPIWTTKRKQTWKKKKINRGSETFGTKTKDLKSNIRIIRVPEGKERGQSGKNIRRNDG